jgi:hypothetical protein
MILLFDYAINICVGIYVLLYCMLVRITIRASVSKFLIFSQIKNSPGINQWMKREAWTHQCAKKLDFECGDYFFSIPSEPWNESSNLNLRAKFKLSERTLICKQCLVGWIGFDVFLTNYPVNYTIFAHFEGWSLLFVYFKYI